MRNFMIDVLSLLVEKVMIFLTCRINGRKKIFVENSMSSRSVGMLRRRCSAGRLG